ncbi:hypothetical protein HRS9139_02400 [Pyrenophora teres f. teres]|nr:hypothetical protein HRS9139_02400 [Pyrenophora teres f. teres]
MQLLSLVAVAGLTASVAARSARSVGKDFELPRPRLTRPLPSVQQHKRQSKQIITTEASKSFAVNGSAGAIPQVDFDIGESYAGLLPISDKANETSELYFWFFPSANQDADDEITIWLNGGPGCSSLEGFLQENGPISWQYGSGPGPVYNPWNWANLTNMVWVEQPVGTGFTQGKPTATSQEEIAAEFLGFFKNFVNTFGLQNRKIYITGESYAGRYVPYIADAMLSANDSSYYDVKGIMFYDPSVADDVLLEDIPSVPFVDNKLPIPTKDATTPNCSIWNDIIKAVTLTNPCFDVYAVATTCPLLWDPLGFPGSFDYLPPNTEIYFNRTDVQKAINAPVQPWAECSNGVLDTDSSPQSSWEVIPRVIDALDRTVIAHGELDFILLYNGTLMAIQNMTWGGVQGFQKPPTDDFYVPYHTDLSLTSLSAKGIMGKTITERKLTYVQQALSGHMVPQYQPSSAYRQLEFLLGRVDSLTSRVGFTTLPAVEQSNATSVVSRDLGVMKNEFKKWF